MESIKAWWRMWWDETLITVGGSLVVIAVITGTWIVFQTTPSPLNEGIMVGNDYTAQYEESHDGGSTCYSYDKNGSCTFRMQNPDIHHTHCIGGCYELQVEGCSNDRRGDAHCRKEWYSVSQATYENCRSGQLWRRGEAKCQPQ